MVSVGIVAKLVAKQDRTADVAEFLASALPLAQQEEDTIAWFALRTDETTFWIVDAFPTDEGRQAHLDGDIAAALMANADELLAEAPQLMPADVLAAKLPG
jgi:quinol monooxygenase YgiN